MICRFCGKKINTTEKCDCCSKELPVLLEYRSYENDSVVEKLSLFSETSDKDIPEESDESSYDLTVASSMDNRKKAPEESVETVETASEDMAKEQNNGNKKKQVTVIIGCVFVMICILVFIFLFVNKNSEEESEMPSESQSTETTPTILTTTELKSDTTSTGIQTTVSQTTISTSINNTTEIADNMSFEGHYYSINNSTFSDESSSNFINVFGIKPVYCSKEIYLNSDSIEYNNYSYDVSIEDNIIALKYNNFADIDDNFIKSFNFNEITQNDEYYNDDNKQNKFYAFNINRHKIDATILGVKLNYLSYGGTFKKYNILDGLCLFSISNSGKDSILWIKYKNGDISIKSSYRNSYDDLNNSSGNIIKSNDGYEIARLSLDGEKDIYFYHQLESQDIYMIQYIKYNIENNGISEAVLRE